MVTKAKQPTLPTSEYGKSLVKEMRKVEREAFDKHTWDQMTNHLDVHRVGDAGPLPTLGEGQDPNSLGTATSQVPMRAKLTDGVYEIRNVILTRTLWDHTLENKTQRMPDFSEYEMRGAEPAMDEETRWQKMGRLLNPKNIDRVTRQPLKVQVKTDPNTGVPTLSTLTIPKDDAEFEMINKALMELYKEQNVRHLVLDFPHCSPNTKPPGNPARIDLNRVLKVLTMAEASKPPVSYRLSSNILTRLAMQPRNDKERILMATIREKEALLKKLVKEDIGKDEVAAKAAKDFLTGEMENNKKDMVAAHKALTDLVAKPGVTPQELKDGIEKLQEAVSKVEDNLNAIKYEVATREMSEKVAKDYQSTLNAAKTTLEDIDRAKANSFNHASLTGHADQEIQKNAKKIDTDLQSIAKTNDATLKTLKTELAPYDEKAAILKKDYDDAITAYKEKADAVANPATVQQLTELKEAMKKVDDLQTQIKAEVDKIVQERGDDPVIGKVYEPLMNDASWGATDELKDKVNSIAAVTADATVTQQEADTLLAEVKASATATNQHAVDLNGEITNQMQTAAAARTP